MQHILKFTLLTMCLVAVARANDRSQPNNHSADDSLLDFLIKTRAVQMENPQRSVSCFDYYMPLLNDLANDYKIEYEKCMLSTEERRAMIDGKMQPDRNEIDCTAENACRKLQQCTAHKDSIKYFECYATVGSENREAMYTISANATELSKYVREQYHLIEYDETRCLNTAQRNYDEQRDETYGELQSCLSGDTQVPNVPAPEPTDTSNLETEEY